MKRPVFFTIWLALLALGTLYDVYSYSLGSKDILVAHPDFPSWAISLLALLGIATLVAIVLLWSWKKIGFYSILALVIIEASVNLVFLGQITALIFGLPAVGILYLSMKPAWKNFK